jgi:hypothetical protein
MPGAWKALASVAGKMVEDVFRPVAFIDNSTTDTQVKHAHTGSCTGSTDWYLLV